MSDLAEDPGGHNLRSRYKWEIVGGMAATLTINAALIVGFNGKLARLLGFDADIPLRNSDVSALALAGFVVMVLGRRASFHQTRDGPSCCSGAD
jgi:hypothetical protein